MGKVNKLLSPYLLKKVTNKIEKNSEKLNYSVSQKKIPPAVF